MFRHIFRFSIVQIFGVLCCAALIGCADYDLDPATSTDPGAISPTTDLPVETVPHSAPGVGIDTDQ
jgi:hypothetical protein